MISSNITSNGGQINEKRNSKSNLRIQYKIRVLRVSQSINLD